MVLAMHAGLVSADGPVTITNGPASAVIDNTGGLTSFDDGSGAPVSVTNDSWSIVVSAYNQTDDNATLAHVSPTLGCKLVNQTTTQSNVTTGYACDAEIGHTKDLQSTPVSFHVNIVWSLNPERIVAEKHAEISLPTSFDAGMTIYTVSLLDGTSLRMNGGANMSGPIIAYNPKNDFRVTEKVPVTLQDCEPSCYIAAFWRSGLSGSFVSIANPYGNYTGNGGNNLQAWYTPQFLYKPGVRSAPMIYASEPVVLGVTHLEPYWINQGNIPFAEDISEGQQTHDYSKIESDTSGDVCSDNNQIQSVMDTSGTWILKSPYTNMSSGSVGAKQCQDLCCSVPECQLFTFAYSKSKTSSTECYLKINGGLQPSSNCDANGPDSCYSGTICQPIGRRVGNDAPGNDLSQTPNIDEAACQSVCCNNSKCIGYTYLSSAPTNFGGCITGKPCCYLKTGQMPPFKPSTDPGIVSSAMRGPAPPPPPPPPPLVPPSPTDINQGEWRYFTRAVETFLLDGLDRKPVRVQVGWDSNDYQMDIANETEWAEYQRLLTIASQMGVTHTTFAPRNTKESARANATDAWQWEEVLWLSLGEKIRQGLWYPGKDPLPSDISKVVSFASSLGIKFLAYAYPTLGLLGPGALPINGDGWLYNKTFHPQPWQVKSNLAASLADPEYQDYLAQLLIDFVTATGVGGFAWDYGINGDWRHPTTYPEWRGWMRILKSLRAAHPDIVMDHRQTAHQWGPWYQLAGSYTEPISGDENPESYGAAGATPTLSTDHVLADNMRRVNFVYRARQLIPNHRVPGFMFHQSERSNSSGPGTGPTDGTSTLIWDHDINTRDFDRSGFKYSLISSVGTAGLNNVLAMLPGRDQEAFDKFPADDKAFVKRWLDWADTQSDVLVNTQVISTLMSDDESGGKPGLDKVDGVAAVSSDGTTGFLFLYNPGPTRPFAEIFLDESIGILPSNGSVARKWIVHEMYPNEELDGFSTPFGLVEEGAQMVVSMRPTKAKVLRLTQVDGPFTLPVVFGVSNKLLTFNSNKLTIGGVNGLSGTTETVEACVPAAVGTNISIAITGWNGMVTKESQSCSTCNLLGGSCSCVYFDMNFNGSIMHEMMSVSSDLPGDEFTGGWYNVSFDLNARMWTQRQERQAAYNITWAARDMDAPWLGNRLLLYPYLLVPEPNATIQAAPRMWVDASEVPMTPAYNSRGHRFGNCFMGYYFNATDFVETASLGSHSLDLLMPSLNSTGGQKLLGVYWYGPEDDYTSVCWAS